MKKGFRTTSVILSLIFLVIVAVAAGFGLAVWDLGSSLSEVYELAFHTQDVVIGDTLVIEDKEFESPGEKQIAKDLAEGKVNDSDSPVISIVDGHLAEGDNQDEPEDTDEVTDENDTDSEESGDENAEREPLKITSEISGIGTVVRAGKEEDSVENNLPVPTQVTATATDIDPQADYPLPYTEVDLSYFDDALFIGDSRVAGLAMNSGTNATFYAVTSFQLYKYKTFKVVQTPNGKVPIFDAMPYDKFTKIYIKVGLNELGSVTDEPFLEAYTNLINDLRVMQPRAIIYIQAVLPVTQAKSNTDSVHNNENIRKRNENLKIFAETMKCYFVDVGPYFADETGALRAETTSDGIHMAGKYMPEWIEALRQNAVVWPPQ